MRVGGGQTGRSDGEGLPLTLRLALVFFVFGVAAMIVASIAILRAPVATSSPTHDLSRPIRTAVRLVPIGDFPTWQALTIADRLHAAYGVPMDVAPPVSVDPRTLDPVTGQLVAERVVGQLGATHAEWQSRVLLIGLAADDLRIADRPDWRWAFAYREDRGVAVVSGARMERPVDFGDATRLNRLTKMVTRTVGFLYYGLQPSHDRSDLLYDSILSITDLDRLPDRL